MKTALVTGASGFIGKHLVNALKLNNYSVTGLTRDQNYLSDLANIVIGDITNRKFVFDMIRKTRPNIVFHLAANKSRDGEIKDIRQCLEDNLLGTLNLVDACIDESCIERFISIGSCEEYGSSKTPFSEEMCDSPVSPYSLSKSLATQLLKTAYRSHGFPSIILRPSVAYGTGQNDGMFLPSLINALLKGEKFSMSKGEQSRDYIYIDDLIEAIILSAEKNEAIGKVINISSASSVLLKDLSYLVANKIENNAKVLLDIGSIDYRQNEIMEYVASNKLAKDVLEWEPKTTIEAGLSKTIDYFRDVLAAEEKCEDTLPF